MLVTYCTLDESSIGQIRTIDRREVIQEMYACVKGTLQLRSEYHNVTGFVPEELEQIIARQRTLLREGGVILGAWLEDVLIGVASVERKRRGTRYRYHKMDILYVSASYRGQGIARRLLEQSKAQARQWGAERLYISATPSRRTIDFYRSQQAVLAEEMDYELLALEPDDIHLELSL